jgi:DNA cross-link repair 1C protein
MSTFDGLLPEFPEIRIDFFRRQSHAQPPLACFLSHVHSDHLAGLDSLLSPFVYCAPATKEILLRLERYPCRINYANGVFEARQQTYKHLRKVLKPLPLGAPTRLELRPGRHIQVTLFDANHCPGAVMFRKTA